MLCYIASSNSHFYLVEALILHLSVDHVTEQELYCLYVHLKDTTYRNASLKYSKAEVFPCIRSSIEILNFLYISFSHLHGT